MIYFNLASNLIGYEWNLIVVVKLKAGWTYLSINTCHIVLDIIRLKCVFHSPYTNHSGHAENAKATQKQLTYWTYVPRQQRWRPIKQHGMPYENKLTCRPTMNLNMTYRCRWVSPEHPPYILELEEHPWSVACSRPFKQCNAWMSLRLDIRPRIWHIHQFGYWCYVGWNPFILKLWTSTSIKSLR
jgi:hypothetical protein